MILETQFCVYDTGIVLKRNPCLHTDNDRVVVVVSVACSCYDSKHILMSGTMQHEQIICRDTSLLFKLMPH